LLEAIAKQLGIAIENARLREYAAAAVLWEERQRLARDLHDSVTQILYSQTLFADAATKSLDVGQTERVYHYLDRLAEGARRALREMRLMIYRLRPSMLEQEGLLGALRRRLELVEERASVQTELIYEVLPSALPAEIEQTLYHIAEEALNNALKHADATEVQVVLTYIGNATGKHIVLRVVDNGCGFDRDQVSAGLGLQSLHERAESLAGTLTVTSQPGKGTRVVAHLPFTEL